MAAGLQLPLSAIAALRAGNKIEAIKLMREATGLGLKEAKECVDRYVNDHPELRTQLAQQNSAGKALLTWVLMMILAIAAILYFWPRS